LVASVERRMRKYPFLDGYSYEMDERVAAASAGSASR
jgi:hypothetical protein